MIQKKKKKAGKLDFLNLKYSVIQETLLRSSLVGLWLGFLAFTAVAGIQSLVVELRSSKWHGKKKKRHC